MREEKTTSRSLAQLKEKQDGMEEKKATRTQDLQAQSEKKAEVNTISEFVYIYLTPGFSQLEARINQLQSDLGRTKQELDNQQAERTKIAYVALLLPETELPNNMT